MKESESEWEGDSCRRICRYFAVCAFRLFDKYKTHFHPGKRQWTVQRRAARRIDREGERDGEARTL